MQTVAKKHRLQNAPHGLLSIDRDAARYLASFLSPPDDSALNLLRRPAFALFFECRVDPQADSRWVDVLTILERTSTPQRWRLEYFVVNRCKIPSQVLFRSQPKGQSLKDFLVNTESFLSTLFVNRFYMGPNEDLFPRPQCKCYLTEARNKRDYEEFLKGYRKHLSAWSTGSGGSFTERNLFCLEFDPNVPLSVNRTDNFSVYLMQRVFYLLFPIMNTPQKKAYAAEMFEKLENATFCLQAPVLEKNVIRDEIEGLWSKAHVVPYY